MDKNACVICNGVFDNLYLLFNGYIEKKFCSAKCRSMYSANLYKIRSTIKIRCCCNCSMNFVSKSTDSSQDKEMCSKCRYEKKFYPRHCPSCGIEHRGGSEGKTIRCFSCSHRRHTKKQTKTKLSLCRACNTKVNIKIGTTESKIICANCKITRFSLNTWIVCRTCGKSGEDKKSCPEGFCGAKYLRINSLVKYFGMDSTKIGTVEIFKEIARIRDTLLIEYSKESLLGIQKKYNHPNVGNMSKTLKYLGIKFRTLREAQNKAIMENSSHGKTFHNHKFKTKWHTTWEGKLFFLRSSYEIEYAEELDRQKIQYEVERVRIPYFSIVENKQRIAICDFHLPQTNEIIELKNSWIFERDLADQLPRKLAFEKAGYIYRIFVDKKEVFLEK